MTPLPLVLLPGLLCDERLWAPQRDALSGVETIVPRLDQDVTVGHMAEHVLDGAPQRFALAGLSMGGYVALEIMRRAPERVERLALLDTQARADTDEARRRRRGLIALSEQGTFRGVTPRLLPMLIHERRQADKDLTGLIMAMADSIGQAGFVRQQQAIMARPDSRPDLGAIAVPTLVLAGKDDVLTPIEVQVEMAAAIPDADLVLLGDCGHLSTLERPDAVTAQLRLWLARPS
ncbi:alpha/beta fold hydrolase [Marinivivus vitaminiproducens]|uniref:alpha/beta fold hydrolase n=1 Tax=Marinivivus vitaminiproducens TaxID=3035935 RepID=UPI0027A269F8|nr:alpha/beta fold hydrolase [Geminicoccaceae bacterium SCSIO 64248]